jgi:sensor histidine kinase YesM
LKNKLTVLFVSILYSFCLNAQNATFPEVEIVDFLIFNKSQKVGAKNSSLLKPINKAKVINLTYKQSQFGFKLATKDKTNSRNIYYSFMLEGLDNNWVIAKENNTANYINLVPGEYIFKAKSSTSNTVWGDEYTSIRLIISPPFWGTAWFISLMAILCIGLIGLFIIIRLKKIKEEAQQKEQLNEYALQKNEAERKLFEAELNSLRSQMNPHFIFNSLSSIQGLINKGEQESANIYLSKFAELLRMILVNSGHQYIPVSEELKALETYLELEKQRIDFEYEINIDSDIDIHNIEIPGMILQPITENAIFHGLAHISNERRLNISLKNKNDEIFCIIEDNGIGIKKSKLRTHNLTTKKQGLGMKLTKERLEVVSKDYGLEYYFEVIDKFELSDNDEGTIVKFSIPITNV